MASTRMAVQKPLPVGMADGETNTHVRQQIKRLPLSKGWTQRELAQAAGISAGSLSCLETGFYRFNLDTLKKIIDALGVDVAEVWPGPKRSGRAEGHAPATKPADPTNFFRMGEVHSLSGAQASCLFAGNPDPGAKSAPEAAPASLRPLYTIHIEESEAWWLSQQLLQGKVAAPWIAYMHRDGCRSLYLCLKGAAVEPWLEELIQCYLARWIAALPL